ncbi:MAG: hypothetical protein BWX88_04407 [Planctomycetes bacterium ADurb.Bin126]|nr:MAG: hypothetical protein BWX88_04407 [Planctomycetes bacterium ADurb.Bin126]HOD81697.1 hypothetical protein [Phycisphaerae bacterium]HQL76121.1 hypothetical protein [Phycisphaerae bacterium]
MRTIRHDIRRRGTVLLEFVMVIPLLAGIIALTYFFGWSMKNQQRVRASNRYAVWRWVHGKHDVNDMNLNLNFFDAKAGDVSIHGWGGGPTQTRDDLQREVGVQSVPAGDLAREELSGASPWPYGCSGAIGASFPTDVTLWQWLTQDGGIRWHHVREGVEWRRHQARCENALTDQFYAGLDDALGSVPSPGDSLGEAARRLYLGGW